MIQNPTQANIDNYTIIRAMANKLIKKQKKFLEKKAPEKIKKYRNNQKIFFEKYTSIKDCFKTRSSLM